MKATADAKTPIMLSGHHYWNLEAYQESQDLIGHHAQFAASRVVAGDSILIPTGELWNVTNTPLDFSKPKSLGVGIQQTTGKEYCGGGRSFSAEVSVSLNEHIFQDAWAMTIVGYMTVTRAPSLCFLFGAFFLASVLT
jgi:galactose mutarotase-like enzyme